MFRALQAPRLFARKFSDNVNFNFQHELNVCCSVVVVMLIYFLLQSDTIFQVASGSQKAGVSVIRVSGPDATQALVKMSRYTPATLPLPRTASLCRVVHAKTKELLDSQASLTSRPARALSGVDLTLSIRRSLSFSRVRRVLPGKIPSSYMSTVLLKKKTQTHTPGFLLVSFSSQAVPLL